MNLPTAPTCLTHNVKMMAEFHEGRLMLYRCAVEGCGAVVRQPKLRKHLLTERPFCPDCDTLMVRNGKSGSQLYWACQSCGITDKTVTRVVLA